MDAIEFLLNALPLPGLHLAQVIIIRIVIHASKRLGVINITRRARVRMQPTAKQSKPYLLDTESSSEHGSVFPGPQLGGRGMVTGSLGGGTQAPDSAHAARATGQWPQSPGRGEVV